MGLHSELGDRAMTAPQIGDRLGLHPRSLFDFLDALVALGLLARDGNGAGALYRNTRDTAVFLDRNSPAYLGGLLEMANARLYPFWGHLTTALRTGEPQNELKHGQDPFAELYTVAISSMPIWRCRAPMW
jgi:hypothetical protein